MKKLIMILLFVSTILHAEVHENYSLYVSMGNSKALALANTIDEVLLICEQNGWMFIRIIEVNYIMREHGLYDVMIIYSYDDGGYY